MSIPCVVDFTPYVFIFCVNNFVALRAFIAGGVLCYYIGANICFGLGAEIRKKQRCKIYDVLAYIVVLRSLLFKVIR